MQKPHLLLIVVAFALGALGCSLLSSAPPTPVPPAPTEAPPTQAHPTQAAPTKPAPTQVPTAVPSLTPAPTEPPTTPTAARLTAEDLKNAEYYLPQYTRTVKLVDGSYESGSGADYIFAKLVEPIAFGDLNGDGLEDAAVLLAENGGGSGVFVSAVVMLNENGHPVQSSNILIDDRPKIDNLVIDGGQIVVTAVVHGPSNPGCCPDFPVTETYAWTPTNLVLVRLSSKTPEGAERSIRLDQPAPGTEVSGSTRVQGTFTISPFENTLTYRAVDGYGKTLAQGSVMARSDGLGGPGLFDAAVDLGGVPPGTQVWLEIADVSPADGSPLALDSALVTVK